MIYETFREAIQNIWSNKFRTFLTMLGIIIGVTQTNFLALKQHLTHAVYGDVEEIGRAHV